MTFRRPADVAFVEADTGTTWVVRVSTGRIHGLTAGGALIWRAADGAADTAALIGTLAVAHGWVKDEIAAPVTGFVGQLLEHGLIDEVSDT